MGSIARPPQNDELLANKLINSPNTPMKPHIGADIGFATNDKAKLAREQQSIRHRDRMINHILAFEYISFIILFIILICYVIYRFINPNFPPLLSDTALNILVVGVFAEITGLVYIVAHYLWWRPKHFIKNK